MALSARLSSLFAMLLMAVASAGCTTVSAEPTIPTGTAAPAFVEVSGTFQPLPGARCHPLADSQDPDIQRWQAELRAMAVEYCVQSFTDRGVFWILQSFRRLDRPTGPAFFLPHDDEDAAFGAAVYAMKTYGGGFMAVASRSGRSRSVPSETRCNFGIDPNRNFTTSRNRPRSCRASHGGCRPISRGAPAYTKAVRRFFEASPFYVERGIVLALHNNANGFSGDGQGGLGDFSILRERPGSFLAGVPFPGALNDEDNVLLTSGPLPYRQNKQAQAVVRTFNSLGINVKYEHVHVSDCSLSNEATLNGWGEAYFNIETQQGDLAHQLAILDALMAYLRVPFSVDQIAQSEAPALR